MKKKLLWNINMVWGWSILAVQLKWHCFSNLQAPIHLQIKKFSSDWRQEQNCFSLHLFFPPFYFSCDMWLLPAEFLQLRNWLYWCSALVWPPRHPTKHWRDGDLWGLRSRFSYSGWLKLNKTDLTTIATTTTTRSKRSQIWMEFGYLVVVFLFRIG